MISPQNNRRLNHNHHPSPAQVRVKVIPAQSSQTTWLLWSLLFVILMCISSIGLAYEDQRPETCPDKHFAFSWQTESGCIKPRGGTTVGAPVEVDQNPSSQWQQLQQDNLSDFERDRRAILAMTGGYRVNFEFIETVNFIDPVKTARPYQSWGTEYVYLVEDRGDFISLQHIMVMVIATDNGFTDPIVMKHWRQDWQYRPKKILEYQGKKSWQSKRIKRSQRKGSWSQSVYQVDDSPRYASYGRWQHTPQFSAWESQPTMRPLPRRERTVRNDYQILEGINRHVILPTGWIQEEENLKRVSLTADKNPSYVARELGYNQYQRLKNFDWQPGDKYWQETQSFWAQVRAYWNDLSKNNKQFFVSPTADGVPMFAQIFALADQSRQSNDSATMSLQEILSQYVSTD